MGDFLTVTCHFFLENSQSGGPGRFQNLLWPMVIHRKPCSCTKQLGSIMDVAASQMGHFPAGFQWFSGWWDSMGFGDSTGVDGDSMRYLVSVFDSKTNARFQFFQQHGEWPHENEADQPRGGLLWQPVRNGIMFPLLPDKLPRGTFDCRTVHVCRTTEPSCFGRVGASTSFVETWKEDRPQIPDAKHIITVLPHDSPYWTCVSHVQWTCNVVNQKTSPACFLSSCALQNGTCKWKYTHPIIKHVD